MDYMVDRPIRIKGWRRPGRPLKMEFAGKGYNWHSHKFGDIFNDPLVRIYSSLHYLTSHAPNKVKARWNQAHIRYMQRTRWHKAGINRRV
jgi:hypothetical protein